MRIRKADLLIGQGGVEAKEHDKNSGTIVSIEEGDITLPDVLTELQPQPTGGTSLVTVIQYDLASATQQSGLFLAQQTPSRAILAQIPVLFQTMHDKLQQEAARGKRAPPQ